jgi:hypothetical protein
VDEQLTDGTIRRQWNGRTLLETTMPAIYGPGDWVTDISMNLQWRVRRREADSARVRYLCARTTQFGAYQAEYFEADEIRRAVEPAPPFIIS